MKPSRVLPKSFHCSAFKNSVRKRRNPLSTFPAQNQLLKSAPHRKPITNAVSIQPMYSAPPKLSPSSSMSKVSSNSPLIPDKSTTSSSKPSNTSESTCSSVITASRYRNLSYKQSPNHKTYYTNDSDEAERLISKLKGSVLGFDMEWKVSYTKHVRKTALVQVCNRDTIILMHICHMERIPNSLKSLLADKSITKCGVNILGDARKLFNDYGVTVNGMLDLGPFAKSTNTFESLKRTRLSLQTLSEAVLGYTLDKGWVRTSDWESLPLSSSQFDYAATDAYACYLLWETIETIRQQLPIEPRNVHSSFSRSELYVNADVGFKYKQLRPN
ncbi:ribonuclease H-like domain-containing protein [Paraphysoderma sedebokerense]|nr:ribonuclease H-like domain-containing protein [Paraphysoderma sedebokerense]